VTAARDVAEAVARYLESEGIRPGVHLGADPPGLGPGQAGRLQCETRALRPDGDTLVTSCFAALADEGAIVMASGPAHAPETSFLAATHVVVLRAGQLVDSMAALWPLLRSSGQPLPRMVNIIRGPSRTADLGVPSRLGAHGPLRVHVILIDDTASAPANV
jgi:L-lactate dehydrogenase complex protein LldG